MKQMINNTDILDKLNIAPLEQTRKNGGGSEVFTANQLDLLDRLDQFNAPWLEEKLLKEGVFSSSEQYQEAFREFKKYVALIALFKKSLPMLSKPVDAVWHQFILFTKQYQAFCEEYLGFYLHHSPNTSFTSNAEAERPAGNFVDQYRQVFGEVPDMWNLSEKASCKNNCSAECEGECSSECSGDCKGGN